MFAQGPNLWTRSGAASSVTSFIVPFSVAVAVGNLQIVAFAVPAGTGIASISDTHGVNFNWLGSNPAAPIGWQMYVAYAACTVAGAGYVITVNLNNPTGTNGYTYWRADFTGANVPAGLFDTGTSAYNSSGLMSNNITPAGPADLIMAFSVNNTNYAAAGTGFGLTSSSALFSGSYFAGEFTLSGSAGNQNVTFATPASSTWAMTTVAFLPLTGGTISTTPLMLMQNSGYNMMIVQDH